MPNSVLLAVLLSALMLSNVLLLALVSANNAAGASDSVIRKGAEYVSVSPEKRHRDHLALGDPITGAYGANLNYTLSAEGFATLISNNSSRDASLSLVLSTWKSTEGLVLMDVMNGTIRIGGEDSPIHSGHAYYLINARQVYVLAYIVDEGSQPSLQVLKLRGKVSGDGHLPTVASESLRAEIVSPQSKIFSQWLLEMEASISLDQEQKNNKVVLTAILDNLGDEERFHSLIGSALGTLRERHPDLDLQVVENQFPYPNERTQLIESVTNGTGIDLMSIDQIWLGELADKGLLTDLSDYTKSWGRASDWYLSNWDGGAYKGKTYGIWVWTDVRGMYYWEDLLEQHDIDPDSLRTWDGYISSAEQLNEDLEPLGIEAVHLTGVGHSPDLWYPYLWMLGGEIVEQRNGHPTNDVYWFPAYNSTEGVEALTFIKRQVDAGIVPQQSHFWGEEFAAKKFAVMMEASHVPAYFVPDQSDDLENRVGYIPMFPTPNESVQTATLMGGWELSIPVTSKHKDLAWELIALMVEPDTLAPWLAKYNYLPTQLPIGQGPYSQQLRETNPFFDDMASLIQFGRSRPSIPEYPEIADHIREAIDDVYYGRKEPKQALDDAAAKSAEALGW